MIGFVSDGGGLFARFRMIIIIIALYGLFRCLQAHLREIALNFYFHTALSRFEVQLYARLERVSFWTFMGLFLSGKT